MINPQKQYESEPVTEEEVAEVLRKAVERARKTLRITDGQREALARR
jgi:hypothetical protein